MENKDLERIVDEACQKINESEKTVESKKNKKGLVAIILAGALALGSILTACGIIKSNKKVSDENSKDNQSTITVSDDLDENLSEDLSEIIEETIDINQIGMEESLPEKENNNNYENATGDVDLDEIVEEIVTNPETDEKEPIIWVDEEAKENASNIGKEEINDQNGTLEVDKDGDVVEKEEQAEIKQEDGTTVTIPVENDDRENNIPGTEVPGYEYDENIDKVVKDEDVNKAVYADSDYYDAITGDIVIEKGTLVTPEDLEMLKNDPNITTTKPVIEETSKDEIKTEEKEETSKEETKPEEVVVVPEVSEPTQNEENSNDTVVDNYGGIVNEDGTYTITFDIEGEKIVITYMDKVTYECWLLDENAEENYGYYNDVIYPISVIEEISKQNQKTK